MEVVALLTAMKEMGFEAGHILSLIAMYWMLHSKLVKIIDKKFSELIDALKDLEKVHNERIQKIEAHIGINTQ